MSSVRKASHLTIPVVCIFPQTLHFLFLMVTPSAELPPGGELSEQCFGAVLQINTVHRWCMMLTSIPKCPSSSHKNISL